MNKSTQQRFPLTHSILDTFLGRYTLTKGSVTKYYDVLHDNGTEGNAQFVIRWGRVDRQNFQIRREGASSIYGTVMKLRRQKYEHTDKKLVSWRDEEKKIINSSLDQIITEKFENAPTVKKKAKM